MPHCRWAIGAIDGNRKVGQLSAGDGTQSEVTPCGSDCCRGPKRCMRRRWPKAQEIPTAQDVPSTTAQWRLQANSPCQRRCVDRSSRGKEPCHQRRCHAFQRQQKRRSGSIGPLQSDHEQQWPSDATRHDRACKIRQVPSAERGLGPPSPGKPPGPAHNGDAEARAAIEKTGQYRRIDGPQQHFGGRGGDAEQSADSKAKTMARWFMR